MSTTLAANEQRRQLRYNFTDPERIEKAKALAEAFNRSAATEAELSRIKKDYAARLDSIQAEVDLLSGSVLSGYELREYVCFWTYDEPRPGRKTLRKREGLEVVAEEDMTERDRQMVMEILDAEAARAADSEALSRPALLAYQLPRDVAEATLDETQIESFDYTAGECLAFADAAFAIFVHTVPGEGASPALQILRDDQSRETALAALLAKRDDKWLASLAAWLRQSPRDQLPGTAWLACALEAYLGGAQSAARRAAAKASAAKKTADKTTRRRAGGSGTVDVPSDEGSRDDAGPDANTKL